MIYIISYYLGTHLWNLIHKNKKWSVHIIFSTHVKHMYSSCFQINRPISNTNEA